MELKDYISIIKRRLVYVVIGFAGVIAIYFATRYKAPIRWTAEAQVTVKQELPAMLSQEFNRAFAGGETMGSRRAKLSGRDVYLLAAQLEEVWIRTSQDDTTGESWDQIDEDTVNKVLDGDPMADKRSEQLERAADHLKGSTSTSSIASDAYAMRITATSGQSEKVAIRMANAVARAMQLFSRDDTRSGYDEFLDSGERVVTRLNERIEQIKQSLEDDPNSPDDKTYRDLVDTLGRRKALRESFASDLRSYEDSLEVVKQQIEDEQRSQHEQMEMVGGTPNAYIQSPATESIDRQLLAKRNLWESYAVTRLPSHPEMMKLDAEIANLEMERNQALAAYQEAIMVDLKSRQRTLETKIGTSKKRISDLYAEIETLINEIDNARPEIAEIERLQEEIRHTQDQMRNKELEQSFQAGYVQKKEYSRRAKVDDNPVKQTWMFWVLLGLMVGGSLGFLVEYFDTAIATEYDIRRHLNIPVLGIIPKVTNQSLILSQLERHDHLAEMFNTLATIVRTAMNDKGARSIAVTSPKPMEGKTTVAVDLAIALARKGLRVGLVDCDLRIPSVHSNLGLRNDTGLTTFLQQFLQEGGAAGGMELTNRAEILAAVEGEAAGLQIEDFLQQTNESGLQILTSGPTPESPVPLLESEAMRRAILDMGSICDIVVLDTPPILNVGDSLTLAGIVDTSLMVVGAEISHRRDVSRAKHLMHNVNADVIGAVLNRARDEKGVEYYYYYSYVDRRVHSR